jgi:hypothetical protein
VRVVCAFGRGVIWGSMTSCCAVMRAIASANPRNVKVSVVSSIKIHKETKKEGREKREAEKSVNLKLGHGI